jgi:hypothetical protein
MTACSPDAAAPRTLARGGPKYWGRPFNKLVPRD